jgi:sporulation protein YlmC with PRC-barrel domain
MAGRDDLDLAYRLLDLDLVDAEGRRCGKVDDLEIAGDAGETAYVGALVAGPGALARRFPRRLRGVGARLFRGGATKIPWSEVADVEAAVVLESSAEDLGLAEGDRALQTTLDRWLG